MNWSMQSTFLRIHHLACSESGPCSGESSIDHCGYDRSKLCSMISILMLDPELLFANLLSCPTTYGILHKSYPGRYSIAFLFLMLQRAKEVDCLFDLDAANFCPCRVLTCLREGRSSFYFPVVQRGAAAAGHLFRLGDRPEARRPIIIIHIRK